MNAATLAKTLELMKCRERKNQRDQLLQPSNRMTPFLALISRFNLEELLFILKSLRKELLRSASGKWDPFHIRCVYVCLVGD